MAAHVPVRSSPERPKFEKSMPVCAPSRMFRRFGLDVTRARCRPTGKFLRAGSIAWVHMTVETARGRPKSKLTEPHTPSHTTFRRARTAPRRQHRPTSGKHEMKKATTPTIATVIDSVSNVHFRTVFVSSGTCAGVSHYAAPDRDAHVIPHHPCTGMRGYRVYVYNYTTCMCL